MHTTNYFETLITVAEDSPNTEAKTPSKPDSIAGLQHALLSARPYALTSDDLLFEVHAQRNGIAKPEREAARAAFFSKPQACLRASPLVKQFGWGLHHDAGGRVAMVDPASADYMRLKERPDVAVRPGMRNKRA